MTRIKKFLHKNYSNKLVFYKINHYQHIKLIFDLKDYQNDQIGKLFFSDIEISLSLQKYMILFFYVK